MSTIQYPIKYFFEQKKKVYSINIKDASDNNIAYAKFIMKQNEDYIIYQDESCTQELFRIKFEKGKNINATAFLVASNDVVLAKTKMKMKASFWKYTLDITSPDDKHLFSIKGSNFLKSLLVSMAESLPVVSWIAPKYLYFKYVIESPSNEVFFECIRKKEDDGLVFSLNKLSNLPEDQENIAMLMILQAILANNYIQFE